jgi:hypothetical protein
LPETKHLLREIDEERKLIKKTIYEGGQDSGASADRIGMEYIKNLHYLKGLEFIIRVIEGDYDL